MIAARERLQLMKETEHVNRMWENQPTAQDRIISDRLEEKIRNDPKSQDAYVAIKIMKEGLDAEVLVTETKSNVIDLSAIITGECINIFTARLFDNCTYTTYVQALLYI